MKSSDKRSVLFKNTAMLYILQFSTYVFSFITLPYQTRVLGTVVYGVLGFAMAVMAYFQLFMDFGFLLSATEDISMNRHDREYINRRLTSITIIKAAFLLISLLVMTVLCLFVPKFAQDPPLYFAYLLAFCINSFVPDYVYRGIENMTVVTFRTVAVKFLFCVLIFVFLRTEQDYMAVPLLTLIGNALAVVISFAYLFRRCGYRFTKVSVSDIVRDFKRSSMFFYSRIATTVYGATNTVILGMVDTVGVLTGHYTSADKVLNIAKNGLSPISDSLYPYMVKNKDFKLVKKMLCLFMPIIVLGCGVVAVFAEPLCIFVFGEEFAGVAPILVSFLPAIISILPSYIFGFPTLGAMGLSRYANYSIFVGTVLHIVGLTVLFLTDSVSGVSLGVMTSISEWSILLFRVAVVFKNRHIMNGSD